MASRFIANPQFFPNVERATVRALDDAGDEIVSKARRNIQPHSSSAARAVTKDSAHQALSGPVVTVKIGRGLGNIFEFSKQQTRFTRSGAGRGVMARREFFNRAIDEVIRRGISLSRYL